MLHESSKPLRIGFILARSFALSPFALFIDTLRLASGGPEATVHASAGWDVIGSTRHLISSSCGVQVAPTCDFVDPSRFDYIVTIGGVPDSDEELRNDVKQYLRRASALGIPLIGLCTGSFMLAEAGLMEDHETCVSWLHANEFRDRFPGLPVRSDRLFNFDAQRGSCAGGSSAADMAASIVRRHLGREAERKALEVLQIERARSANDVQPRRPLYSDFDDDRIKAAIIAMEQHLEFGISIPKLAAKIGLSRRQLERLFATKTGMSPAQAFMRVRLERAKDSLLRSKRPIFEIALDVGFGSSSQFAKTFRRVYGLSPSEIRSSSPSRSHAA